MSDERWQAALPLEELSASGRKVVRLGTRQLAVFMTPSGPKACNNRCPHEGYPLAEGELDGGCRLTCHWHNWKFDLDTGENLLGGDALRVYPARVRDGQVEVDLSEPPLGERRRRATQGLREAFDDDDGPRLARELARLERLAVDRDYALRLAVAWSHDRLEFGFTHAYAGAADWLELGDELDDPGERLATTTEAMAHVARDVLRMPPHPYPEGSAPFDAARLQAAIEAEDEAAAVAQVRGALAADVPLEPLLGALARAALAHYADFGHSLIYVQKTFALLERWAGTRAVDAGERDIAETLLLPLTRSLVLATREDRIPEFAAYAPAVAAFAHGGDERLHAEDLLPLGTAAALERVVQCAARPPLELYRELLRAAAHRLWSFDTGWEARTDRPVSDNIGWLDFTHAITFASALRHLAARHPELWAPGLLQMACFVGRIRRYVTSQGRAPMKPQSDAEAVFSEARAGLVDHGLGLPIFAVHRLKTFMAARAEHRSGFGSAELSAGLGRFLGAWIKQRHALRAARQALAFVAREE